MDRYLIELQEWLFKSWKAASDGVPVGFKAATPGTISGTTVASAGTEDAGWMAADASFALDTSGVPGVASLAPSAQGAGPGVSLSGHTHQVTASPLPSMARTFLLMGG